MSSWGSHGSIDMQRYIQAKDPKSRRRCHCGCKQRSTHLGMANGVCLAEGCELSMRRWVRDPLHSMRMRHRLRQQTPRAAANPLVTNQIPIGEIE